MQEKMSEAYLIVEENQFFSEILVQSISSKVDYPLVVAKTYQQASQLIAAKTTIFLAAITSYVLSDCADGQIVDLLLDQDIPTIVLTSMSGEEVKDRLLGKNIVDYVFKQELLDTAYLVAVLKRVSRNTAIKVLVVDDSKATRNLIVKMLKAHRYQVLEAGNGHDAIGLINQEPGISLVITDYEMPGLNGVQLIRAIRQKYNASQLPVIGLSSISDTDVTIAFLKNGANDFLYKPFRKEIFYNRINQNLDLLDYINVVKESAYRDFLTGLPNRKYFFEKVEPLYLQALSEETPAVLAVLDIDHFKSVNDIFGHDVGDLVLKKVADVLRSSLRSKDVVARFGGKSLPFFSIIWIMPRP